ncbi:MAG TPA: glycosyltransferase family 2 protein [Bacillota bacterium]|nr:glycosyltransferase family 2 protein [Bacillota bacterium]
MELGVLIPAYNEAAYIGKTITALKRVPQVREITVIDDGSTDKTAAEAERHGARVFRLPRNRGKAYAVLCGARLIRQPYLALVDADLGDSAEELFHLLQPLQEGRAEMAVALFPRGRVKGGLGLVKKLAAWFIYRGTGCLLREPLSGQRVLRRDLLAMLRHTPRGFGLEVALSLDLLRQGYAVVEVETRMSHRERGRDAASILHRGRQFAAVLRELWLRRDLLLRGSNG